MSNRSNAGSVNPKLEALTIDSRKLLSIINSSAQSQIKFFAEAVEKLGTQQSANWKLTSLNSSRIIIEDLDSGGYLTADYLRQKGGKITINNIRGLNVTEGDKSTIFESACSALIDAIDRGDLHAQESAFSKLSANRFRSTAVPNSGMVKTKDGLVRHIKVRNSGINEDIGRLANKIVSNLQDRVVTEGGEVSGTFTQPSARISLPVSELSNRRVVAYHMRNKAKNAYFSPNFQALTESVAGLVSKGTDEDLKKAINLTAPFLKEYQELSLLNSDQIGDLVGNALATKGVFNESLIKDTAALFQRVNMRINRDDIVNAWKETAKAADHPVMLENVKMLEEVLENTDKFSNRYDDFLSTIFEAVGETTCEALLTGLQMLKKDGGQDEETLAQIDDLIGKLSNASSADDQATWEAIDLLARVNKQLSQSNDLSEFDTIPGSEDKSVTSVSPSEQGGGTIGGGTIDGGDGTTINIYTGKADPNTGVTTPSADDLGGLDDLDLDDIDLEGGEGGDEGGEVPSDDEGVEGADKLDATTTESRYRRSPLTEDQNSKLNTLMDNIASPEIKSGLEIEDDYVLPEGVAQVDIDQNYGVHVFNEYVINQKLTDLDNMIRSKGVQPKDLETELDALAEATLAGDASLQDPTMKLKAKNELIGAYAKKQADDQRRKAQPNLQENQYKVPTKILKRKGLKKSAINQLVTEGKFNWLMKESDGVLGTFKGVNFVLDHAYPPVISSFNGEVEVVIPEGLVPGALYFAEVKNVEADADGFVEWLNENIEKLRPTSPEDERAINEAVAKLTVSPDVKVEIEVDSAAVGGDLTPPVDTLPPAPPVVSEPPVAPEVGEPPVDASVDAPLDAVDSAVDGAVDDGDGSVIDDLEELENLGGEEASEEPKSESKPPKSDKSKDKGEEKEEKEDKAGDDDLESMEEAVRQVLNTLTESEVVTECKTCSSDPCKCCKKCKGHPCKCARPPVPMQGFHPLHLMNKKREMVAK